MTAIIILAAGLSSRMGKAKPLLTWGNESLIKHIVSRALESEVGPVGVVLGSKADLIFPELENLPVHVIHNERFEEGQGTSVQAGAAWAKHNQYDGVIFMTCDQPLITADDLQKIAKSGDEYSDVIVGSRYGDTLGVPAYFGSALYVDLMQVKPSEGAKAVMLAAKTRSDIEVEEIDLPHALHDLDTPSDYQRMTSFEGNP
jgi:molybdenum cofactor cytidylyltransferase